MGEVTSVGIPGIFGLAGVKTAYSDEGEPLGDVTAINFVGQGVTASLTENVLTVEIPGGQNTAIGLVAITDITPTTTGNVSNKVTSNGGYVLESCDSSTINITVHVLAVAGSTFMPSVNVNGIAATMTYNEGSDTWHGTADITTLEGDAPYIVTATHSDGATDTCTVVADTAPTITSIAVSNLYPNEGQTSHYGGQQFTVTITSDTPFKELWLIDDNSATTALHQILPEDHTEYSFTATAASRTGNYAVKAKVAKANGTQSAIATSSTLIALDNVLPSVAFGTITYPEGQYAIKDSESATIAVSSSGASSVAYSSGNGDLAIDSGDTSSVTVSRVNGGYNISTNNLHVVATKTSNATTATADCCVKIAHDAPSITITKPASRLISSPTGYNHLITLSSTQQFIVSSLDAGVGAWQGAWSGSFATSQTRNLQITDVMTKGNTSFSNLVAVGLAGRAAAIGSGASYVVGGFTERAILLPLWDGSNSVSNRSAAIGTQITDVNKVLAYNASQFGSPLLTYVNAIGDQANSYAVLQAGSLSATGNTLYMRDKAFLIGSTVAQTQINISEYA